MHVEHTEIAPQHIRLTLNISKDDYMPGVEKTTKDLAKTIAIKGFRKGMVPTGIVKKMHGTQIMVEELNKKIDAEINKFIKDNQMDIFGRPLPLENEHRFDVDINNPGDFVFDYELGLTPTFELNIPADPITYYEVSVDDKTLEDDITYWRNRHGALYNPDTIGDDDKIKVILTETDNKGEVIENGIVSETQLAISAIKDAGIRSQFIGKKKGDTLTGIDIFKAFDNNEKEIADHILKTDTERLNDSSHIYSATIEDVFNITPAEMDEAFFEKMYPGGGITDESTFRQRRIEDIGKEFTSMSLNKFGAMVKDKMVAENDLLLPAGFLKKLVIDNKNREKKESTADTSDEAIDASMPDLIERLKWDLLSNRIARENELTLNEQELMDYVKFRVRGAYMNYSMEPEFDGVINSIAQNLISKEENRMKYAEELLDSKVIDWLVQRVPKANTPITIEEFYKL